MRSDMAKVIVERPRHGSSMRGPDKGYRRRLARVPLDERGQRESMTKALHWRSKFFNEHLAPLRRYLQKQVGRPWSKVFAEICANLSRDSAVQDHVRDHVHDYAADNIIDIKGVLHCATRWGGLYPLHGYRRFPSFYVCPKTGLLKKTKSRARKSKGGETPPDVRMPIEHDISFVRKAGIWKWVRFARFPKAVRHDALGHPLPVPDVLQGASVSRTEAVRLYGKAVIAKEVRHATPEEIRKYCEPLKSPNRV